MAHRPGVALLVAAGMGLFLWELDHGADLDTARSVAVNAIVMGEIMYLFNCRHMNASAFSWENLVGNRTVLLAIGVLLVFQMLFTYLPLMQTLFGTAGIGLASWGRIILSAIALMLIVEVEKLLLRRKLFAAAR